MEPHGWLDKIRIVRFLSMPVAFLLAVEKLQGRTVNFYGMLFIFLVRHLEALGPPIDTTGITNHLTPCYQWFILVPVNNSNTVAHEIPEATESKNTSLDVPRELWKRVKVAAAQADITMRQYVIDSLERSLDQKRTIKK